MRAQCPQLLQNSDPVRYRNKTLNCLNDFRVVERNGDDERRVAVFDGRIRWVEEREVDIYPLSDEGAARRRGRWT